MSDDVPNLTLAILRQIRDNTAETNAKLDAHIAQTHGGFASLGARIDETNTHLGETNDRVGDLEQACIRGFTAVRAEFEVLNRSVASIGQRVDNALRITGDASRVQGARIDSLEVRVDRIEAGRTKPGR